MNYYHLNMDERTVISQLALSGCSIREISRILNRNHSTISRELKRNSYLTGINGCIKRYTPVNAQNKYKERRKSCGRKRIRNEEVLTYIQKRIREHWSPEQIKGRGHETLHIPAFSTIYRLIHDGEIENVQMISLRRKGHFSRPAEKRGKFNDGGRTIKKREKDIYKRNEVGHWEGDTVESGRFDHKRKSKTCFVTLAERKSRKYIAVKVRDRTSLNVTPAIIKALSKFPDEAVKTITFDRGKEFSGYEEIEKTLHCKTYFCDPYCAWQKGTNENSNGLLREFYPKGTDLSEADENELIKNLDLMNNRPRKILNYRTPNEVFNELCINT